ncbi:LysR family transcriptional regulator [Teichococcus oryzae]|uniref:LysR family transcriptional regulator n=1 Tax=Teichococcus oryzae TaxID=1608942 RepID=A0A5B2TF03_9PROT|nr:LysR family transcriptional regulator [Pseudoroseomonas oryzae]KAA2213072.1 LysR family transcriptional regulator [Pseudoroseomonas oryzae]
MSRRFDWNDLRYLLAVSRAGTVSLAARRMGADHATVIRRIDALEQALGVKLVERNPRGYHLTQRGEALLASARRMEEEAERAQHALAGGDAPLSGLVRISSLEGFGNFFLAGRLPRFAARNPDVAVELITIQQILALSRREADLAITLQPPDSDRFLREKLTDYALLVYGSVGYLARAPALRSADDLAAHPFISYIDDLVFMRGLDYLDEIRRGLRARLQSSSLHAQMEAACAGHGLCVLPAFMARTRPQLRPVLPDTLRLTRSYWLVSEAAAAGTRRLRAMRDFIRAEVRAEQALFLPP